MVNQNLKSDHIRDEKTKYVIFREKCTQIVHKYAHNLVSNMALNILAHIKQHIGGELIPNIKMTKVHLALTMEKSWKYIASASLKPSFTTIDC